MTDSPVEEIFQKIHNRILAAISAGDATFVGAMVVVITHPNDCSGSAAEIPLDVQRDRVIATLPYISGDTIRHHLARAMSEQFGETVQ